LLLLYRGVPESRDESRTGGLDWIGALLATVGLGALVLGLIEAGVLGFGARIAQVSLVLGVVLLAAFLVVQARGASPMMQLDLFRSRAFSGANFLTLLLYGALGGALFFFPFNLIQVQDYSATAAGAAFLPLILIMFALSRWSGGLVDRYGGRLPLVAGPAIAAVGFALFAVPSVGGSYWTTFFPAIVVLGLGMAIAVPPLTTVVLGAADERRAGVASGINNAIARVAGLVAIAVMGIVLLGAFNANLDAALAGVDLPAAARQALMDGRAGLAAMPIPDGLGDAGAAAVRAAIDGAFVSGFRLVMLVAAGLALAGAVGAWLTVPPKQAKPSSA
ncbi:MAG: MFS transporter, partial [Minwuiales bacterium]|nr:MFS transporter [Minwuiales bacterium]